MAGFNLSFYKGEDKYSDGDNVENYIYEMVSAGCTLDDIREEDITWPVFYHLTPIRENICNWYPFKSGASILEIGSGCGAVTGVLCQNAAKVTSVELSKRRASINYERNKQYDNLDIIVGNLNDIKLEEKYDYITLIGVLEYAGRFTEGEKPFHAFLMNLKKYLKPDGALLIAIENRLGLKYFSGAPEDHTGRIFDGINGYPYYDGVRTFSKSELTELLQECGLVNSRFYYPYPDYKLPNEIFTDYSMNRSKRPYYTYDVDRYSLFWENNLQESLQRENVASVFSNSFFVEAREVTECDDSIIYAKLNQDRKAEFRVGTVIYRRDGKEVVEKKAFHKRALSQVDRICKNDNRKYGSIEAIKGERHEDSIVYPFISVETLDGRLKKLAIKNNKEEFIDLLKNFFKAVRDGAEMHKYLGREFTEVFGVEGELESEAECLCPANIDLAPSNVYYDGDTYYISDCEWVFDFPIPTEFVIWRSIRALYVNIPTIGEMIKENDLLSELEVTDYHIDIFIKWEKHFIENYVWSKGRGIPKSNNFKQIIYGKEERFKQTLEEYQKEIIRVKERVNYLLGRIDFAHEQVTALSKRRMFKLVHLVDIIKGKLTNSTASTDFNCLHKIDDALYGSGDYTAERIEYKCDISAAKRIDIITPGHTLFLAKQLSSYLKECGIESQIHDSSINEFEQIPYILICANIMAQFPKCYICYQMEQTINSRWLTDRYIKVLENAQAVLDYSCVNIEFFNKYEEIKNKLYYVPMGISSDEVSNLPMSKNQDIDVLFYGDINCDRRKKIIDELGKTFNVCVESDLFGEEMHDVIERSKVVINIHYYEGALLETPRIAEILSIGTSIIVSERSNDSDEENRFMSFVDFVNVGDVEAMKKRILFWLNNEEERRKKLECNKNLIGQGNIDSRLFFKRFLQDQNII